MIGKVRPVHSLDSGVATRSQPGQARSERLEAMRRAAEARVLTLARAVLPLSDGISDELVREICHQAGLNLPTFRTIFHSNDDLLRKVNQALVEECSARVAEAAEGFTPLPGESDLQAAARSLAEAWPMDWASLSIRSRERANAVSRRIGVSEVTASERRFMPALLDSFLTMVGRLEREFSWPPLLAVRVIILSYERSFEAWVMDGGDERTFASSPFVRRTLPEILDQVTSPLARAPHDQIPESTTR